MKNKLYIFGIYLLTVVNTFAAWHEDLPFEARVYFAILDTEPDGKMFLKSLDDSELISVYINFLNNPTEFRQKYDINPSLSYSDVGFLLGYVRFRGKDNPSWKQLRVYLPQYLTGTNKGARFGAISSLSAIGTHEDVDFLMSLLDVGGIGSQGRVIEALLRIGGATTISKLQYWLKTKHEKIEKGNLSEIEKNKLLAITKHVERITGEMLKHYPNQKFELTEDQKMSLESNIQMFHAEYPHLYSEEEWLESHLGKPETTPLPPRE